MAVINNMVIPEVLNNYHVYSNEGDKLLGITGALTLAPVQMMTATVSGAGIGGEYATPVVGKVQSVQQEVPFRTFYGGLAAFNDATRLTGVTIRGALQCRRTDNGLIVPTGFRVVIRGSVTSLNPGSVQIGNTMEGTITWEVMYELFEVDGTKVLEFDKLNDIYIVNGEDVSEPFRRLC